MGGRGPRPLDAIHGGRREGGLLGSGEADDVKMKYPYDAYYNALLYLHL